MHHIQDSSYLIVNIENYTLQCFDQGAQSFNGCRSCIITIESGCIFLDTGFFIPEWVSQTHNADNDAKAHTTNVPLLLKFFDGDALSRVKGDTLLGEEPILHLPDFLYFKHTAAGAFIKDEKLKIDLEHATSAVRNDQVILSGISRALLNEADFEKVDGFWITTPGIVIESSGLMILVRIMNGAYLCYRYRALALSLAILQNQMVPARAEEPEALIFSYSRSTPRQRFVENNVTETEGLHQIIVNVTNVVWPKALAILTLVVLLALLAKKLYKKRQSAIEGHLKCSMFLQFTAGTDSACVRIASIYGLVEDFHFSVKEYIKEIKVVGYWRPKLVFKWPSLIITNVMTQIEFTPSESHNPVAIFERLRK